MAFNITSGHDACPADPEALLRDLRKKTIPGLLSHQADLIRSYLQVHTTQKDITLQLPTGSGKTLVGLLIAEWRRRKYGERVVYLCPTNQLVHQVVNHAVTKYGLDVHAFTGKKSQYNPKAASSWQNAEIVAVTNYSSLFNTKPFFSTPQLIILDDAHSAENYIASFWSLLIEQSNPQHEAAFSALLGVIAPLLSPADRSRLNGRPNKREDQSWVEKIATPLFHGAASEIISLLDEHTEHNSLRHSWQLIRDSLHACQLYVSRRAILIRPLIPPTNTHAPFNGANQRLYMSATLGSGGELERIIGRCPIHRIPVPPGWDRQGIGRRFFLFPKRSLHESEFCPFVMESIRHAGRALYLVPDDRAAEQVSKEITDTIGFPVFSASQIEESKQPFVSAENAVAVVANRYDGIDLVGDECKLLFVDGLPEGANLQEKFLVLRVGAQLLLDDRILTRLVQGFGRCTRSANDYAGVVILSENLSSYLFAREHREFFHPEIQAELEFGLEQSKDTTASSMLENLKIFLTQSPEWDNAEKEILTLRSKMTQRRLAATEELASAVESEIKYQYAIWDGNYNSALEHCRAVMAKLRHNDLRGYRALWLYLAGATAWLAYQAGQLGSDEVAKDYFRQAQAAAPVLRWLVGLQIPKTTPAAVAEATTDTYVCTLVERLEVVFEELGMVHDRKYAAEESEILKEILQSEDGILFEHGHERLGRLLGFEAGNSTDDGAPDPWWIADGSLCFVFEDHAEGKSDTVFSVRKARQAASHPNWILSNIQLADQPEIIPILITPCTATTKGAVPHLKQVKYWHIEKFREWAKRSLQVIREIRRDFPGPGNLSWRDSAAQRLSAAQIGPIQLKSLLKESAAEAMTEVAGPDEDDQ